MNEIFAVETAKIVGTPSRSCWAQTHSFSPDDPLKKEKRGDFFAVLVLRGLGEGVEAISAGREVLGRLHEEYYGNLEGSAFIRLSESVDKVCREEGAEICAAVLLSNVLYLAIFGKGSVFLKREGKFLRILNGDGELKTASGFVKENDLLLLGSEVFYQTAGNKISEITPNNDELEELIEPLASEILGKSETPDAAAMFLLFKKENENLQIEDVPAEEPIEEKEPLVLKEPIKEKRGLFSKKRIVVKREGFKQKKRLYFILSIILLAVLGVSLIFGIKKTLEKNKETKAKSFLSQSEEKFNQSKAVFVNEPEQGRVLAQEAKTLAENALQVINDYNEALQIKTQIEEFLSSSIQDMSFSELPVFMDLNLIQDNAEGVSLAVLDKNLLILDANQKNIYLLDYEKKSNKVLDFLTEEGKMLLGFNEQVMVYSPKGIEKVGINSKSSIVEIENSGWKNIIGFSAFNNNLYLLDSGKNDIWRYSAVNGGYSEGKSWFTGTLPDLSDSVSMAIDGSVWVLQKSGIAKFNLGKEENFSLTKMPASPPASPRGEQAGPENFENPIKIYTSENEEKLYVLDKGRGKIYQISKTGEFEVAYSWEGIKQADDFVAIEEIKKIFLLSGSKIFEIGMKE